WRSSLTLWRVRGPGWFCLWALNLVEVRGSRAGGETSVSRGCSVSLMVTPGCPFPTSWRSGMLFASAFVGVPAALAGKGLVIPTEPCSRGSPPTLFRLNSNPSESLGLWVAARPSGSVREVGSLQWYQCSGVQQDF
ncbi:hypothetical protein Taro_050841, partial [Colocasia esculenta]|nr:hypothetical protein [Colocasia esculenta]